MAEGCRKLQDEEVRNLCSSLDIIREMKLRRMRWAAHITLRGSTAIHTKF